KYDLEFESREKAASRTFRQVKMFYGNAYEALTSNFAVLACLNNIGSGRSFDQFSGMKLDKYLMLHKASRARAFEGTESFAAFAEDLNSALRNASHHGAMRFVEPEQRIEYRSGGTGRPEKMAYIDYLIA